MSADTLANALRPRLAAVVTGTAMPGELSAYPVNHVLTVAHREGICALLAMRLGRADENADDLQALLEHAVRGLVATEMGQRAELRRVLEALGEIEVLVLKGHALAQWLYPAPYLRECSDIDLLFASREQAEAAAAALRGGGYRMPYRPGRFAHELMCRRPGAAADLDMHWALTAIPALDRLPDFETLRAHAVDLPGLGKRAMGLSPAHALLHACVHRASNLGAGLGDRLKWMYDIHLLATRFTALEWDDFAIACRDARIAGLAAAALHASHAMFATALPAAPLLQLKQDGGADALDATRLSDWRYVQRRNFAALHGMGAKAGWLWARAFPPMGYLRELYGSEQGWLGLMFQRAQRFSNRVNLRPDSTDG